MAVENSSGPCMTGGWRSPHSRSSTLGSGEVYLYELLVRMLDDHGELILPASFLHIAERYGVVAQIDEWVAGSAIQLLSANPSLRLAVNISGRSLGDQALLATIEERLRESRSIRLGCASKSPKPPRSPTSVAHSFAHRLREHGCRLALDDFGAGFGSFYYLKFCRSTTSRSMVSSFRTPRAGRSTRS